MYSIKAEVDRTKEAIVDGRLWEHLMKKMHSHPKLYEARGTVAAAQDIIAPSTPQFKQGATFLYEPIDFSTRLTSGMVLILSNEHGRQIL